jgi:diguanylate cyclase (GGDEF)-like protein
MHKISKRVKEQIHRHNLIALLFFLLIFGIIQLFLFYAAEMKWLTIESIVFLEGVTLIGVSLSFFVARLRFKDFKALDASIQDLAINYEEIRALIENTDGIIIQISLQGAVQWVSGPCEGLIGQVGSQVDRGSFQTLFKEVLGDQLNQGFQQVVVNKGKLVLEDQDILWPMGQQMTMTVSMTYMEDEHLPYVLWVGQDKSSEKQANSMKESMLQINGLLSSDLSSDLYYDQLLRALVDLMPSVEFAHLLLENEERRLVVKAQIGYLPQSIKSFTAEIKESLFFRRCGRHFQKSIIIDPLSIDENSPDVVLLQNYTGKPALSIISCPILVDGKLIGLINIESSLKQAFKLSDIEFMDFVGCQVSKIVSISQWIEQGIYHSKYDVLTGLYNRWQLDEFQRNTLPRSLRYKESFLFVSMTLNHLEEMNDHYGYQTGDLYLMTFAKLLKNYSRETDLVFRMGGDQFVGIFFTNDVFTFNGKLEALEQALAADMNGVAAIDVKCSFAYGIVTFPEEGQGVTEMYNLADQRMKDKAIEMKDDVRYAIKRAE